MKIVVIEPLAVEEKRFLEIARAAVGQEHEIVCYDTRTTDVKELGERGKDADIIALGNLPFPREVLEMCIRDSTWSRVSRLFRKLLPHF